MNIANKKRKKYGLMDKNKYNKGVHFCVKIFSTYTAVNLALGKEGFQKERGIGRSMEYTCTVQLTVIEKGRVEYGVSENTAVFEYTLEYTLSVHNVAVRVVGRCGPLSLCKVIYTEDHRVRIIYRD